MRFKYRDYTFTINPHSKSMDFEYIGDDLVTLSGKIISQPTCYKNKISVSATLWQPRDRFLDKFYSIGSDVIDFNNGKFYGYDKTNNLLKEYDTVFRIIDSFSVSLDMDEIYDITVMNNIAYISCDYMTETRIYKIDLSNPSLVEYGVLTESFVVRGLTNDGNYLLFLTDNGDIYTYDYSINTYSKYMVTNVPDYYGLYLYNDLFLTCYVDIDTKILHMIDISGNIIDGTDVINNIINIKTISFNDNKLYILDESKDINVFNINTVAYDLEKLKSEIKNGIAYLYDQYGRKYRVLPNSLDISISERIYKARNIRLSIEGVR